MANTNICPAAGHPLPLPSPMVKSPWKSLISYWFCYMFSRNVCFSYWNSILFNVSTSHPGRARPPVGLWALKINAFPTEFQYFSTYQLHSLGPRRGPALRIIVFPKHFHYFSIFHTSTAWAPWGAPASKIIGFPFVFFNTFCKTSCIFNGKSMIIDHTMGGGLAAAGGGSYMHACMHLHTYIRM